MKSSCSDNNLFRHICNKSVSDNNVFRSFRSDSIYSSIVETVGYIGGKGYIEKILKKRPFYSKYLKKFAENDLLGSPKTYKYKYGFLGLKKCNFSPTTLRYINEVADLEIFFSTLNDFNIIEIGAGYGGLCRIISERFKFKSYTIIDIEPSLNLAKKFLKHFNIHNVIYLTPDQIAKPVSDYNYDLLISNYAFSELSREWQQIYFSQILKASRRGYMLCNFESHTWDENQYSENELLKSIENCTVIKDESILAKDDIANKISLLIWNP